MWMRVVDWIPTYSHSHGRYFRRLVCFSFAGCMSSSWLAPMKLVPLSDLSCFAGPLTAKNLCRALMPLAVFIDSMTSMCTARVLIHVKIIAHLCFQLHRLWCAEWPLSMDQNVQAHVCKWRRCTEAFRRKICHLLNYLLSSESAHVTQQWRI